MRTLLILLTFVLPLLLSAQPRSTGEVFDPEFYNTLPLKAKVSSRTVFPPRVSLEKYCPTPGDQGAFGTCAAWSSAYHFRTIMEAKRRGITDRATINKMTYSPTWVYELLKDTTDLNCDGGIMTAKSLLVFKEFGVPAYSKLPFTCLDGTQEERFAELDKLIPEAASAKIRDLQILFYAKEGVAAEEKIQAIKKVLAEGYPVLVSHTLLKSFQPSKEVWRTAPGEGMADEHGSHAMVIVGYDDEKFGGAFRYLNSWGSSWGDGGFIWVPYATTAAYCYGAYQAFPLATAPPVPAPTPTPAPAPVALELPAGGMQFMTNTGDLMPVSRVSTRNLITEDDPAINGTPELPAYRMQHPYPSGTRFRFYLETKVEGYVYAFASDLSREVNKIFPYDDQVSPLVGANSLIAFPSDTKVIRMDNNPGTDYLLVLFSREPLDEKELMRRMQRETGGLTSKISAALGDQLIDPKQVEFSAGEVNFKVKPGAKGTVVPVLVEITHR